MFDDYVEGPADPELCGLSDSELEAELCTHAAHVTVAECRLTLLLGEVDRRRIWEARGLSSCAEWCSWRLGTSLPTAREQVRVGRALASLPAIRAAFAAGEISYSKVRAITRVATPALEASLLEMARYATAAQLELIVREYRKADPGEGRAALARHRDRYLRTWTDLDGSVVINARLSPEDGAVVLAAIEAARRAMAEDETSSDHPEGAESDPTPGSWVSTEASDVTPMGASDPDGASGPARWNDPSEGPGTAASDPGALWRNDGVSAETLDPVAAARADALVALCEERLSAPAPGGARSRPTSTVLVHVDEAVLADAGAEGCAHVEGVGTISSHTAQRLACDAAVSKLRFRTDGTVVPEGKTRQIPASLRRAVLSRDRGCRWPGCTRRRYLDVHHVVFVSNGGRTILSNLVATCRHHHRLVHEGGWRLRMDDSARVRVWSPDGQEVPPVHPPTVPAGPSLEDQHRADGLRLGPETVAYCGAPFDLDITVDCLLRRAYPGNEPLSDDQHMTPDARVTA